MNKRLLSVCAVAIAFACSLGAVAGEAENEGEVVKVMAVGMGIDSDMALKNALKNAVSQTVGSIIGSATIVANDEVIEDKILSHSGGFVETYDIVGEPKAKDGLVSVTIEAIVKRMNLKREMEANNIFHVKKIDGKVFTKQIQLEEAGAMFKSMLEGFPDNCLSLKVKGDPYFDDKKDQFVVEVTLAVDQEKVNALIKDLIAFLDAALPEPAEIVRSEISESKGNKNWHFGVKPTGKRQFILPVFINSKMTAATWKRYTLNEDLYNVCREVFLKPPPMVIDITIDGDISIFKKHAQLDVPYTFTPDDDDNLAGCVIIAPYLNYYYGGSYYFSYFYPGKAEETYVYRFDLDVEEVKMVKDVKVGVER